MERTEQLKIFIDENPADTFSRYALGLEYIKQEKLTEAEICFQFLIEHHPDYIGTYYQYGKLLQQVGKEEEAKTVYKKGMELTKNTNLKTYSELQNALTNLDLGLEE